MCVCVLHTKERERAKIHFIFFLVRMNNFYSYLGYSPLLQQKKRRGGEETTNMYFFYDVVSIRFVINDNQRD